MHRFAALASLLLGCVSQPMPVRFFDARTDGLNAEPRLLDSIHEGCERVGLECYADQRDDRGRGAITITVFDSPGGFVAGRTQASAACFKACWVIDDPIVVAHEVGHLFGLHHVDDPDNIMYPVLEKMSADVDLDDDQRHQLERRSARFVGGCNPP